MRMTCAEPSFPTSPSGFWVSAFMPPPPLMSVLLAVDAEKVASGITGVT